MASNWFDFNYLDGWLTCPLTQNGCVRVLSQPQYPRPLSLIVAMDFLQSAVSSQYHRFIPDDDSLLDDGLIDDRQLLGHRQLTDVYLLALAVTHDARLVTRDTRISLDAVHGANESHLMVI